MKRIPRLVVLAGLVLLSLNVFSQDTNRFVFLCFGQSNMEGFPGIEKQDAGPVDERFQVLAAVDFPKQGRAQGNWYPANPPLCRPRPDFAQWIILAARWFPTCRLTSRSAS